MKKSRKTIAVILSLAMIISLGAVENWMSQSVYGVTAFTITSPKDGKATGAGYMDIQWTDASGYGTVNKYQVYVDGSYLGETKSLSYEYYTTKVNYHTTFVVATFSDGSQISTPTIRFGVTKKGLAIATGMGAKNVAPYELNAGWYYNWGTTPFSYTGYDDVDYVPMIWSNKNINNDIENAKKLSSKYLLGFNEPDYQNQANMTVDLSATLWPALINTGKKVGSPATGTWPQNNTKWFQPFMTKINNNVDFIAIHCYPDGWDGGQSMSDWFLQNVVDWTWNKYHKPIWITEFYTSGSNITEGGTTSFLQYVMPELDSREYVERYSFFSFDRKTFNGGLWYYSTGALSGAGQKYRDLGNPKTDAPQGNISNNYAHSKAIPSGQSGTTPTTTTPATVTKPGKAKIKTLKNVKGKKIKVTLKKVSRAVGYQIYYSDDKGFDGYETKNTKKTTATLTGLDKKTRYYVKARAYVKNGTGKLYGSWSSKKNVMVKK